VLLFWRLHNMLDATVNMLRLEAMDYKRELQEDIRDVLNRISIDEDAKIRLISGKRVVLAEEIEVLRHLQSKLEQFTKQLKKEGKLR
jgi:optic atrophy protein 1